MRKTFFACLTLLLGCGGNPLPDGVELDAVDAPESDLAAVESPLAGAFSGTMEDADVGRINAHRVSHVGAPRISVRGCLRDRARAHSKYMASKGTLVHTSNLGAHITADCPSVTWAGFGENVGVGPDEASTFAAFLRSADHHANIDHRSWNQTGVGIWKGADGRVWITQIYADWR